MIVVVEGGDAVGKRTLAGHLRGHFAACGVDADLLSFPQYGTPSGVTIRKLLQEGGEVPDRHVILQALMTVNRVEALPLLRDFMDRHDAVMVLDRYVPSGLVYGAAQGCDPVWLRQIHATLPEADCGLLVDLPVEESFRRRPERRDRHEVDRPLLERVRRDYVDLWLDRQRAEPDFWAILDGTQDRASVTAAALAAIARCAGPRIAAACRRPIALPEAA